MEKFQLPTLEDVARQAKVSTATVSRCLSRPETVRRSTRERVMQVVGELGYTPNFGAQAMAAKRTNTIGAVIPTMDNAIFAKGLQAFQEEISNRGASLLVASSSYRKDVEEKQIRSLIARGVDALLLIGDDRDNEVYDYLAKRRIPYVLAWNHRKGARHTFVGFDNFRAAYEMAERVVGYGHRDIAMIAGVTDSNDRARDRLSGVRQALSDHGIPGLAVTECAYSIDAAGDVFETIVSGDRRPTAIVCGNDVLAAGAIIRAKSMGVEVPRDISVTGFDDIELATVVEPGITTVHVPHGRMGRSAATALFTALENRRPRSRRLETRIVERQSLAAPRQ
ncbi:LacI family DNA-binding transcriptional regulator [Nitratireductor sp. XY-223]|uniref:LacI family DNA-binding transcriptional regulator n=1 Tax=Nitratireductor sp. XY-223 TaxID=2561926 RepID=UPI001FF034DE|nr:LacI family DNA-binding transcriptional regulator [Nitratireductor sp. XY-223]